MESSEPEPTRTCGACHKEVAEANFALHESHCKRFLSVCPDCDEAVPRELLSQHREEQHSQVKCSKCNKKMERCHLEDHEADDCPERLQACQFCELEVAWRNLHEHAVACGSRTERCSDCGRYVKLSDQPEHKSTCSTADDKKDSPQAAGGPADTGDRVSCRGCRRLLLSDEINQHLRFCYSASPLLYDEEEEEEEDFYRDQLSAAYKATYSQVGGDPDQISTCPHCHLALPLSTLKWHEAKCRIHVFLKDREG
ncbi:XIAP-associated factor 1 [Cyprinodon tularosa]|uniref:XIAP-associated factor 1 n=1 Tax=Cyprinodon tularosa TaxID=77115 RepID=UPI0018E27939|nr:XIAP-associated factor 1 [Cyprinodon tularosa]